MSLSSHEMPRISRIFKIYIISVISGVFFLAEPGYAKRKYVMGTSVDFMAGLGNQTGQSSFNLSRLEEGTVPSYGVYPSLSLSSEGQRSMIILDYSFVGEYFQMSPDLTTTSHAFTGSFEGQLSKTVRMRLSDTLSTVPDFSTINVLQGFAYTPDGFQYAFEPQLYESSSISNRSNFELDIDMSPQSFITFATSSSYRNYDDSVATGYFNDQLRLEGSFAFSHRTSARQSWSARYRIWRNDYEGYDATRSHSATLSLSRELSPGLNLILEAGPSLTESNEAMESYAGYIVSASMAKRTERNLFTAGYSHRPGDSTGLGTSSDSHQGNLGFSRSIGRTGSINFQASAFRQSQRLTDIYDYWGARGSLALSRQLWEHWTVSIGGSYMTYLGRTTSTYDDTYKRFYVSFGFRLPELYRGQR